MALLTATSNGTKSEFVASIVRSYAQNLTVEEMATCATFSKTRAYQSVNEALQKIAQTWNSKFFSGTQKDTPLARAVHTIING